jgi:dipeptidase D
MNPTADALLEGLRPKDLWRSFLALSAIPRGSGNEAAAAAWIEAEARRLGCEVERDRAGNLLARKRASPGREDRPGVVLQGHVDMVCEKDSATAHDFERDPIDVFRDGDLLRARGTTLGADNGIGVAAALAVLAAPDVRHGPLEVLVTVDEETGLTGANALAPGWLRARYLLNLDSEELGDLTIGCAGGVDTVATRAVRLEPAPAGLERLRVAVTGLRGGHSGVDIAAGRGNALRLLGTALDELSPRHGLRLASVSGGNKRNAIAREAFAEVAVEPARAAALREDLARLEAEWRSALGDFDPGVRLAAEPGDSLPVMAAADAAAVVRLLAAAPHGVEAMSPSIPGLVQTSTNLGVAATRGDRVEVTFLTRSALDASKRSLAGRIAAACALAGFDVRSSGGYPGWKPEPAASLVRTVDDAHAELFGRRMRVKAIHAGLECGIIGEKYPGLEMVSFGPDIHDAHSPRENVSIPSVETFWRLLVAVLERV